MEYIKRMVDSLVSENGTSDPFELCDDTGVFVLYPFRLCDRWFGYDDIQGHTAGT